MGILLGLLAAFGWGTGDYITRGATRQVGALRAILYTQLFGLGAVLLLAALMGELARAGTIPLGGWLLGIAGGTIGVFASFSLFNAFEHGVLMIVSPIAASYAAITVLLSLVSGETLSPLRATGVICSIIGVILASIELTPSDEQGILALRGTKLPPGIGWALLAALLFGVNFWVLGFYMVPALGPVLPVAVTRAVGVVAMSTLALLTRKSARPPARRVALLIVVIALLDTAAFAANNFGMETEQVSVVAVLSSLFAAVTVLLAWLFLHERIRWGQWVGIALILLGILLVSL